jgi:DNA-3-methyladenine glycosylase
VRLGKAFFTQEALEVAPLLLGKFLVSHIGGAKTVGKIVETEAYCGVEDKACHAYNNRRTRRTEVMFQEGGLAYITLCYGLHHMFNVVTGKANSPQAVLIRAIEPIENVSLMLERRSMLPPKKQFTSGPGTLTKALGITTDYHGISLIDSDLIYLEDSNIIIDERNIVASPRVGIDYAEAWKDMPWRFRLRYSAWAGK